jgi:hypothetical protein
MDCSSSPHQSATSKPKDTADLAYQDALHAARFEAGDSCASLRCQGNSTCGYLERKIEGTTTFDPTTEKWTSTQLSSGECHCASDEPRMDCDASVKQTVVFLDRQRGDARRVALELARKFAEHACAAKNCPPPQQPAKTCKYQESSNAGDTTPDKLDPNLWKSVQTSEGRCQCL